MHLFLVNSCFHIFLKKKPTPSSLKFETIYKSCRNIKKAMMTCKKCLYNGKCCWIKSCVVVLIKLVYIRLCIDVFEELINYVGYMLKMWVDDCIYFKIVQDIYKCFIDYLPFLKSCTMLHRLSPLSENTTLYYQDYWHCSVVSLNIKHIVI
jgi:hypothetical protein